MNICNAQIKLEANKHTTILMSEILDKPFLKTKKIMVGKYNQQYLFASKESIETNKLKI